MLSLVAKTCVALAVVLGLGVAVATLVDGAVTFAFATEAARELPTHADSEPMGRYQVSYAGAEADIPLNKHFELELVVLEGGRPVLGADVRVGCAMPDHGHGMTVRPKVKEIGGGRYRVDGMLLHMAGRWELAVDIDTERATFDFVLL